MKNKKQLTLQDKLALRKFKKPNWLLFQLYRIATRTRFLGGKYKPKFTIIDNPSKYKGPCFIIWNHQSRADHAYLCWAAGGRRVSILAGYNEFFRSHLHGVFKKMKIVPKKIFWNDTISMKALYQLIKRNACIAFSPEGTVSNTGEQQPIAPGTGRFIQFFKIPVYYMDLKGAFLSQPKVAQNDYQGEVEVKMSLLFTKEDLKLMSPQEIEDKINSAFKTDDFDYQKKKHIKWKHKNNMMEGFPSLLYKCPICGEEYQMEALNNTIHCKNCDFSAHFNDYWDLIPDGDFKIPSTPTMWSRWERSVIIKNIRENDNYFYTDHCKIGYLPPYHFVKNRETSEICGEGFFTVDHTGFHFKGTKLGQPFSFDLDYRQIFSVVTVLDFTRFALHPNGEYLEFFPDKKEVIKIMQIVEEMHRLHVNNWKSLPWLEYLYDTSKEHIE